MFNTYEFTFAGESSLMYGMVVCDIDGQGQEEVSFGNVAEIIETRTTNRIQPVHYGVNYHTEPLEFTLIFGSERMLDRYELEEISLWLTGHQEYQWLAIDQQDMDNVQFRCLITELKPIYHGWLPHAFEATIRCDCPYAYSQPWEQTFAISGTVPILFRNESSVREYVKPTLVFEVNPGTTEVGIVNHSDNDREFKLSGLPAGGLTITVDNNHGIIQDDTGSYNLYEYFNMNFFRLVRGDNELEVTGNGALTMQGRFLRNVAG